MKQTFLQQIENKIKKNRVVKLVNAKSKALNNFLNKGADNWDINMKQHTITKRYTPFEEKLLEATG